MKYLGKYYFQIPTPRQGFICLSFNKHNKLLSYDAYIGKGIHLNMMLLKISLTFYFKRNKPKGF